MNQSNVGQTIGNKIMSIKTELTHSEFMTLYRDNQFVRDFSYEAAIEVLNHIETIQDESETVNLDWTPYFMEASEYSAGDILAENNNFEIDEFADQLIEIARDIDFESDINDILENSESSNETLWKDLKDRLLANTEFEQEAASFIADEANLTGLDNGKWLKLY